MKTLSEFFQLLVSVIAATLFTIWMMVAWVLMLLFIIVIWLCGVRIKVDKKGKTIGFVRWFKYTPKQEGTGPWAS